MPKIGTGYISVDADLSPFWRTVEREMATGGSKAGRTFSKSLGDGIDDRAISKSLDRVERSTRRATKGFEGLAASFGDGNDGIRRAARSLDNFGGAGAGATATIGGLRVAVAALIPLMIGFGGASVAAASSLGPLIGLLAAGGNVASAAAQGLGVFSLATMGVSDALKEQADKHLASAGAAVSDASQQRSAARAIQSAHDGVRDAVARLSEAERDAGRAQKDLNAARTEARRALTDMASGLQDAILTEQRAILGLRDAKAELAKTIAGASPEDLAAAQAAVTDAALDQTQAVLNLSKAQDAYNASLTDPAVSPQDRAQALVDLARAQEAVAASQRSGVASQEALAKMQSGATDEEKAAAVLDVADAEQRVTEARRDRIRQEKELAAAQKAGVEGSKQVVAAHEAIRQADRRVQDAERDVARATQAVTDAQEAAAAAMTKGGIAAANLNKKFDDLPPAAQAFTKELLSLKPKFDALRDTAASGFFPGATKGLQAAVKNFDSVNKVVDVTAKSLGEAARKSGELVGSPAFGKDLETIGGRNAKVIDTLGEALRHVVSALRYVALAAGPLTQHLADMVLGWTKTAASAAKAGEENGRLAHFFAQTEAITRRLLSVLGHLTHGLIGVGKAGKDTGDGIWVSIDRAAKRFDKWANSSKGQTQLKEFFKQSRDLAAALIPVLTGVGKGIAFVSLKSGVLATIMRLLGPYTDEATVAFIAYKAATIAVAAATNVATVATKAYALWVGRMSVNAILWRASLLAAAAATAVSTAAQWALNVAMTALPIGLVVVGIGALIAGFVLLGGKLSWITDAFEVVWGVIKDGATAVLGWLKTNWPTLLAILGGPIGLVVVAVVKNWDTIKSATIAAWNAIKSFLGGVWNAIASVASGVFNGIRDAIGAVWSAIRSAATTAWSALTSLAGSAWEGIRTAILTPLREARDLVKTIWDSMSNAAGDAWHAMTKAIGGFAGDVKNAIGDAFRGAANQVIGFVNAIIKAINIIPGIPNIDPIKALADPDDKKVQHRAMGGKVTAPMAIVGEQAPTHPEYVIPTNPAYRGRALGLTAQLMKDLGMPGFAMGGILGKAVGAVTGFVGKLPGIGDLPDWLKGTGSWVLEHIGKWIKDKVASIVPGLGGGGSGGGGTSGSNQALGKKMMLAFGFSASEWPALRTLWQNESGWNDAAVNPTSGASGIPQSLPASKMGAGWQHNPAQQIAWGLRYIKGAYGSPSNALAQWMARSPHWYAKGGVLPFAGSFADGGIVGGSYGSPAMATVHGGEAIVPDGGVLVGVLREHTAELRALRQSGVSGVMASITDHVLERGGQDAVRRRMTAGNPTVTAILS